MSSGGDVPTALDGLDKEITWLKNSKPGFVFALNHAVKC